MAWIDWDAVIAALDGGRLPASGGEKRIVRIAASLAAGHPVSLRDAIPGLDRQSLELVTTAIRRAAGQCE
jgi:energy-coupling factor transporter ATP-binding protein EcfA2